MSKSASLPSQPSDESLQEFRLEPGTPAWKQEVNQRLAAHRNRRGETQDSNSTRSESPRPSSSRAAEAAARVAARYAKAPSYSQLLAGEARAVVRAAGAAAEAARNAQAAAEAVLAGLETPGLWDSIDSIAAEHRTSAEIALHPMAAASAHVPVCRWQDEPIRVQETAPAQIQTQNQNQIPAQNQVQIPDSPMPWAGAQPRWEASLPNPSDERGRDVWSEMRVHPGADASFDTTPDTGHETEFFRYEDHGNHHSFDPIGSATVDPVQHIPANLIEFPRELVATKKARPRLAEGPLFEEDKEDSPQLNIFEVDPELLAPPIYMSSALVAPPEWASIELDHPEETHAEAEQHGARYGKQYAEHYGGHYAESAAYSESAHAQFASAVLQPADYTSAIALEEPAAVVSEPVQTPKLAAKSIQKVEPANSKAVELLVAPVSDRMLASVVDCALVVLAVVAAAVVVTAATAHPPSGRIALMAAACGLVIFGLLYQFLFLSYAEEGTPGMRYARIALCTFNDDNPSRAQMRQRIPALAFSVLPGCLGLLWAVFDKEHLSWHDRMTRTYQRKY